MKNEVFEFVQNEACPISNILYRRAVAAGRGLPGLDQLGSGRDRMAFIDLLRRGGRDIAETVGIPYVDTSSVHDVTSGASPFGDLFFCDMLASLYSFQPGRRVLDFGCSSGRVIRNLKAALPHIAAYGCDPRASSIDYIAPRVRNVEFFTSNQAPPIASVPYEFDMVFAISVWSHFSELRALEWFDEMARIIVPGGSLIFSTHGLRSVYHFAETKRSMPEDRALERLAALRNGEFHFRRYSATDLDSQWGMAFIPRSWVASRLAAKWKLAHFAPGLAMANQDVYVLERL